MTVAQLIRQLQSVDDQDMRVMVKGYEGGFNDLETSASNIQDMALDVHEQWYYGAHEIAADVYGDPNNKYEIIKALIL